MASKVTDKMKKILSLKKENKPYTAIISEYVNQLSVFLNAFKTKPNIKDLTNVAGTFKDFLVDDIISHVAPDQYDQFLFFFGDFIHSDTPDDQFNLIRPHISNVIHYSYVVRANNPQKPAVYMFDFINYPGYTQKEVYMFFLKTCIELNEDLFEIFFNDFENASDKFDLIQALKDQFPPAIASTPLDNKIVVNALKILLKLFLQDIPTHSAYGLIRIPWTRLPKNQVSIFTTMFQETAEITKCEQFTFLHYMFLFDMKITDSDIWAVAFATCKSDITFYFGKFIAVLYMDKLLNLTQSDHEQIIRLTQNETQTSKTYTAPRIEFVKKFKNYIEQPFKSGMTLRVPILNFENFDFDRVGHYPAYDDKLFMALCNAKSSPFLIGLLDALHYLFYSMPPVIHHTTLSSIFPLTIPALFSEISNISHCEFGEYYLSTAVNIFNDPTIWTVLDRNYFEIYVEALLMHMFSNDNKIKIVALNGACNTIRLMQPGYQLLVQPFLFLSETESKVDTKFYAYVTLTSTRMEGNRAPVIEFLDMRISKVYSNTILYKKFKDDEHLKLLDIAASAYETVRSSFITNAFACMVQIIIELQIQGLESLPIEAAIHKRFNALESDALEMIPALTTFENLCPRFLKNILHQLIEKDAVTYAETITNTFLNSTIDLKSEFVLYIEKVKNVTGNNEIKQSLLDLVTNYKRFPFMNGSTNSDSFFNPFPDKDSHVSHAFVHDHHSLITARTLEDRCVINTFHVAAKTTFEVRAVHANLYKFDPTIEVDIPRPVSESVQGFPDDFPLPFEFDFNAALERRKAPPPQEKPEEPPAELKDKDSTLIFAYDALNQLAMLKHSNLIPFTSTLRGTVCSAASWPTRFSHKIGVLYIPSNARTQKEVLATDYGSTGFYSFLKDFGYHVEVKSHLAYSGGLDTVGCSTGNTSVYYADCTNETMFHVSPLMLSSGDDQNVYKKRHIGNDVVHIIYSEDTCEYDRELIVSQFNHAHIFIYPSVQGYAVMDAVRKDNVSFFGIVCGAVTHRTELVPALARATAIEADRVARKEMTVKRGVPDNVNKIIIPAALKEEETLDNLEANMM